MPLTRPTLHGALNDYAQELNIKIEWDTAATKFFEDHNSAGVILADGRVETADLVVAADGIGSKSWELVNGHKPTYIDSGLTCHVATCPADVVHKNKVIADGFGDFERGMLFSLGPGMHFGMGRTEEDISWTMVHKTRKNHSETAVEWGKGGTHESALSYCEGWAPFYKEIVKATPSDEILLWNLTWRDPHPNWVSSRGRVVQLGDSAHPFIPTSGAGATMAMEDAYSLAACLHLGGKPNIPLALKVHNRLRFERVSCAQKNAFRNSEKFHNTDWDAVAKDPGMSANFTGDWLSSHNVEQYTYDNYEKVVSHIVMGTPFENTNTPPGYTFKPWSIKEMMEASERGQPIIDEGEWS
ncbi:FAD-dependent monooxygenase mdpD [Lasiodiplodia theobromae]|uniref:FAD-dependent monooxygenase mdpD n=1 Tax=Lasiodiplodia theobromae TaxID=45133 RepID=A0A5N5D388_9PEZI|nr:FAD-dependent monooxygenase mdpD [Lasiodiplodia theobromae]